MNSSAAAKPKKTAVPAAGQAPIKIKPDEGRKLVECAAKTGQTTGEFIRMIVLEGIAKVEATNPTSIPCPFCNQADCLEIIAWTSERREMTEYQGDAVKCHRCEAIAPATAWMRLGLHNAATCPAKIKGGAA